MKTFTISALAAAAFFAAIPLAVAGSGGWGMHQGGGMGGMGMGMGGPMGGMAQRMMERFDANKDGKITQDEINKLQAEEFAKANTDGQGGVSLQEFEPWFYQQHRDMMVRAFQFLDRSGDGQITPDEVSALTSNAVQRFDRNNDGALSPDDRGRRGEGRRGMHQGWWGGGDRDGGQDDDGSGDQQ
jgi:Ca2+-binding EF-hand superfamily protein